MPTHVCDTGLNGYIPPAALLLSGNCAVNLVLSDIPLISVGILVFGASMFFLTIRRFTVPALCLYFAVLVAFSSAILDLGQILVLEASRRPSLAAIQTAHGLVLAREVLLAISIGLLFFFYWILVAEPSRRESRPSPLLQGSWSDFLILESNDGLHSGTWARWGLVGYTLKYILLVAPLVISVLSIVWRADSQFDRYSNVYAAEISLELIASILLGLKLMINALGASSTLKEYAAPLFALLIHIGISIGNLLSFAFIESTPGRFLFGAEIYVLIVHAMSATFHRMPQAFPITEFEIEEPYFQSMKLPRQPRSSTFRVSPPVVTTPRMSTIVLNPPPNSDRNPSTEALRRVARASSARMASWISGRLSRRLSRRVTTLDDTTHLWARRDAEEGSLNSSSASEKDVSPLSEESIDWRNLVNTVVGNSLPDSPVGTSAAASRRQTALMSSSQELELPARPAPAAPPRLRTSELDFQLPNASASNESLPMMITPAEAKAQDSPIYSLHGILPRIPPPLPPPPPMHDPSVTSSPSSRSDTSIEELLRQQNELDKSIAALRLFAHHSSVSQISDLGESDGGHDPREGASSPDTNRTSDFSLSHFPNPPWAAATTPGPSSPRSTLTVPGSRQRRSGISRLSSGDTVVLQPPRLPAVDMPSSPHSQSIPESPNQDTDSLSPNVGRLARFNSGGTQYDVTSFIGDLTTPGGHRSGFPERPWETHKRSISENPSLLVPPSRSSSLVKPAPTGPRLGPGRLSGLPSSPAKYRNASPIASGSVAPLKVGSSKLCQVETMPTETETKTAPDHSRAPGSPNSPEPVTVVSIQPTIPEVPAQTSPKRIPGLRSVVGLPARPTVSRDISAPKPLPQDGRGDLAPHAFERPRPPPLLLRPYAGTSAGEPGNGS